MKPPAKPMTTAHPASTISPAKARALAISGTKLVKSQAPRTRKERIQVIEDSFGHLPIR